MYLKKVEEFFLKLGVAKKIVLSTSSKNRVTSRTMSFVIFNNKFYCQTDKNFLKYQQIIENPNVSLCIDNIQIEGVAIAEGSPLENKIFIKLFEEYYKNSYLNYSFLEDEILLEITPTLINIWDYENEKPLRKYYDLKKKTYIESYYQL